LGVEPLSWLEWGSAERNSTESTEAQRKDRTILAATWQKLPNSGKQELIRSQQVHKRVGGLGVRTAFWTAGSPGRRPVVAQSIPAAAGVVEQRLHGVLAVESATSGSQWSLTRLL